MKEGLQKYLLSQILSQGKMRNKVPHPVLKIISKTTCFFYEIQFNSRVHFVKGMGH